MNAIIEAAEVAADDIMRKAEQQADKRNRGADARGVQARADAEAYARDKTEVADSYGTQHRRTVEGEVGAC